MPRRSSHINPADLAPKYQAQIAAQLQRHAVGMPPIAPEPAKKRLRQAQGEIMNKLETRFYRERLVPDYVNNGDTVLIQAVRLELARSHWYKPDFFLPAKFQEWPTRKAIAYELKGPHAFRGGFENLKVAARVHNWCQFFLVWEKDGKWERQEILP